MAETNNTIMWFRQDLRLHDNPALSHALLNTQHQKASEIASEIASQKSTSITGKLYLVYIYDTHWCHSGSGNDQGDDYCIDETSRFDYSMGQASKWWLHHSLKSLNQSLDNSLHIIAGNPIDVISKLVAQWSVNHVYWNRCYEPWQIARDKTMKENLKELSVNAQSFNANVLWEPWQIKNQSGLPYKVFTPYFRKGCLSAPEPRRPISKPKEIDAVFDNLMDEGLNHLDLMPKISWYEDMANRWQPGEDGAHERLSLFLNESIDEYKTARDVPSMTATSYLSPHFHFGEISPNTVWYRVIEANKEKQSTPCDTLLSIPETTSTKKLAAGVDDENVDSYLSELVWREFSHYLLYHFPSLPYQNFNAKFDHYPWRNNPQKQSFNDENFELIAWQKGLTGVPIVDAGMRELWQTGYMHNRVRMIVGSFLVKNLNTHWRCGEAWFWDCLLDADLAANSASWQWVAGSGVDAAPFFRIFNPILQGEKFDKNGDYVRQYCPELNHLPNKYIHCPWQAPMDVLSKASVRLGVDYPFPIVDLKSSRNAALEAFQAIK